MNTISMEKVIEGLRHCTAWAGLHECQPKVGPDCPYEDEADCKLALMRDALAKLNELYSLLGIQQTADSITFLSTGTAKQGEDLGLMLGKAFMHEWIYKELLHKGLLTDEIRLVFEQAKSI